MDQTRDWAERVSGLCCSAKHANIKVSHASCEWRHYADYGCHDTDEGSGIRIIPSMEAGHGLRLFIGLPTQGRKLSARHRGLEPRWHLKVQTPWPMSWVPPRSAG